MRANGLKFGLVTLLAVVSLGGVSPAHAGSRFRADIPFVFTVDNTTLPAGAYMLSEIAPGVLVIRNENDGQDAAIVLASSPQATTRQDSAELIFRRSGNRYFLGQVQILEGSKRLSAWQAPGAFQEVLAVSLRRG